MKISKQGAKVIKTLIVLVVLTLILSQVFAEQVLIFIYPALMLGLIFLLPVFHHYRKTPDFSFFGNLCFATILAMSFLLIMPLVDKIGFHGYAALAFLFVFFAVAAEKLMESDIDATLMTIIFLVMMTLLRELQTFAYAAPAFLITAILLDLARRFPMWVRGFFAGLVWSTILFGFSQLDWVLSATAVVYSSAAGLVAASFFSILHLEDEKHIEKLLKKW